MMQTEREYAEALFTLAVEEGAVEAYSDALGTVKGVVEENPEYIDFLCSPAISLPERVQAIDEAFSESFPENVVSFLKILCENGRIRTLLECIEEYGKFAMELSSKTVAEIYSAVPLDDEQKKKICLKLSKVTGKDVEAVYIIDESLIGGIRIEVEGKTFDGSIRHRLSEVKDVIIG